MYHVTTTVTLTLITLTTLIYPAVQHNLSHLTLQRTAVIKRYVPAL